MSKNAFLRALNELGQSIWYDNLSLEVLRSGELAELVDQGVSGLTSNPTIFKKAIADTDHYDDKIKSLTESVASTDDLVEELMIQDVGAAADLLLDTYQRTHGEDGYASIEVSPLLAHDTGGTVAAAERIWEKLGRPNIMIKIPATEEGIPAIQQTLEKGINVNVTLIFSVPVYQQVVQAYLTALNNRADSANVDSIASVASFFVSRVDALVEKTLGSLDSVTEEQKNEIVGKIGIANSKLAYEYFHQAFGEEAFATLKGKGARVQRPLWASTGVKNPDFSELLYVEELAGSNTVNTLPPKTLQCLMKDATILPKLQTDLDQAKSSLKTLSDVGIDLAQLLTQLQIEGVDSFKQSYVDLIEAVENKRSLLAA